MKKHLRCYGLILLCCLLSLSVMLPVAQAAPAQPYANTIVENTPPTEAELAAYTTYTIHNMTEALAFNWNNLKPGTVLEFDYNGGVPYTLRLLVTTRGTQQAQVIIRGIPGPNGERPIIEGADAVTVTPSPDFHPNALINIGGVNGAHWITLEGLEIRNANHHNGFYANKSAATTTPYSKGARGVYFQAGSHFTLRNCEIHDCGNGLFSYSSAGSDVFDRATYDMLVEYNHIHSNGVPSTDPAVAGHISDSMLDHNSYCATIRTTYQYNTYGPLLEDAWGYGLKDRGSGTVIRYNTISGGRRQISLDDGQDNPDNILNQPDYHDSYVFGNVLIEQNDGFMRLWGDDEIISYGGDDPSILDREGTLFFYNNTVITYRKDGTRPAGDFYPGTGPNYNRSERTSIFYVVPNATVECRNNIFMCLSDGNYTPAPLALWSAGRGTVRFMGNLIYSPSGWCTSADGIRPTLDGIEYKHNYADPNPDMGTNATTDTLPFDLATTSFPADSAAITMTPNALHDICKGDLAVTMLPMRGGPRYATKTVGAYEFDNQVPPVVEPSASPTASATDASATTPTATPIPLPPEGPKTGDTKVWMLALVTALAAGCALAATAGIKARKAR